MKIDTIKSFSVLSILLCFSFFVFGQNRNHQIYKVQQVLDMIRQKYVDTIDIPDLTEKAIVHILEQLDPHSVYIPKERVSKVNEPLKGSFEGVGIRFSILKDTIYVLSTIEGGPSEKVGVQAGDRIVQIEKENVAGIGIQNEGVANRLRGKKGTEVNILIIRQGEKKPLLFTVTRDKIPLHTVMASYMVSDHIGYIKLSRFAANSPKEILEAMTKLRKQGMKDLIFDLQGNGGGYLNAAFNIANQFLDDNKMIVYTEGEHASKREFRATKHGYFKEGRLVVLVNESSASASEIVSGAIQDWDRGLIVGRRTFGKGLVQKSFMLLDSSVIRLTVANYYTPTGRFIQKPYDSNRKMYYRDIENRMNQGELMHKDSIQVTDSLVFQTYGGRKVYGGGGIIPDVFIPIDTTQTSALYRSLFRKGMIQKQALSYVDKQRKKILFKHRNIADYIEYFSIPNKMISQLKKMSEKEDVEWVDSDFKQSESLIKIQLKAIIARNLWGSNAFYKVYNQLNKPYLYAVEVLTHPAIYKDYKIIKYF